MHKLRFACLLAVAVVLVGCAINPVETTESTNPQVAVSLLFEHDGCKVYRFTDNNKYVYYSKCLQPSQVSWDDVTSTGKVTIVTPQQVNTVLARE